MTNTRAFFFLFLISNFLTIAQSIAQDSKRIKLAEDFILAIKEGKQANEKIMKTFVVEGNYLKNDTIKEMANKYLIFLHGLKDFDIVVIKYLEIEKEFEVPGVHEIGDDSKGNIKLKFELFTSYSKQARKVNLNDLYVIKSINQKTHRPEEGGIFILFQEDNKIISFAGTTTGNKTSLIQF